MRLTEIGVVLLFSIYFETVSASNCSEGPQIVIHGLMSLQGSETKFRGRVPVFLASTEVRIRLFGTDFLKYNNIAVTASANSCEYKQEVLSTSGDCEYSVSATVLMSVDGRGYQPYYLCAKVDGTWYHQGTAEWMTFYIHNPVLVVPLWMAVILIMLGISLSALMSGLNLGLMALDLSELTVMCRSGAGEEKDYARQILSVRKTGNFLLCSILFACTISNAMFTVIVDNMIGNFETIVIVSLVIVILCEIIPQAVCSRMPLLIGAKTLYITKAVMVLTAPLSYPIGKLLDKILGKEIIKYPKERLKELIKIAEIATTEVAIISGTLEMSKIKVEDIMTELEDTYKLPLTTVLDYSTIGSIVLSGYSRIPIYDGETSNIVHVILTKDLAIIDPSDNIPIKTLCEYSTYNYKFIPHTTTIDVAFNILKEGGVHMAFVTNKDENGKDATIGIVTLEDILEEVIQGEILDETDVLSDNRSKRKIFNADRSRNIRMMLRKYASHSVSVTPQMKSAAWNYLASLDVFKKDRITEVVLKRLLKMKLIEKLTPHCDLEESYIYTKGKEADYFVMILEGKVEVSVGKENLLFEGGPFLCFGHPALEMDVDGEVKYTGFIPDYSVLAITEVNFIKILQLVYLAALKVSGLVQVNEEFISERSKFNLIVAILEKETANEESPDSIRDSVTQSQGSK